MRAFVLIPLLFTATAHAQFGTGLSPGSACPGQYAPSNQAFSGDSDLMNLRGQLDAREERIEQLKEQEKIYNKEIARAKDDMGEVLTGQGIAAIREHRERRCGFGSYRRACGGPSGHVNSAGPATDPELFSSAPISRPIDPNLSQVAPPDGFCINNPATGHLENIWEKFVEDEGTVSDHICDFRIAGITRSSDRHDRDHCHDGMHDYYRAMDKKADLDDEIARLDDEARMYRRRLQRITDEITEGTYCPWCAAQRRGYSTQGTGNSIMQQGGILQALAAAMGRQNRSPYSYGPPAVLPYGGAGYPVRPYTASVPGYYGMSGPRPGLMNYGAVPGGIGPGGFGCQGTGLNSQLPIFGQQSPFNNPYANPAMAPMFNQGAGPGWGFPQYANGLPGFDQGGIYGEPNLFPPNPFPSQSPYAVGPYGQPNAFAPNPYAQNPYAQNGYPPGILPYQNQFGLGPVNGYNPYDSYGSNPYAGGPYGPYAGNGYGGQFGPGYPLQGGYGAPAFPIGGIPNYGYQNPWGAPLGSPVGSFYGQVNLLSNRMQWLQGGTYFGGGGGGPQPIMPYLNTPTPVYNTPGGWLNPLPRSGPPPAILLIQ